MQQHRRNSDPDGRHIDMNQNYFDREQGHVSHGSGHLTAADISGGRQESEARGTAVHIKLNKAICTAADRVGAEGVLEIVDANLELMSVVNLSSALHRLSIARYDGDCQLGGDPRFVALCARTSDELDKQVSAFDESTPRCWSTIAWSYAKLQQSAPGVEHMLTRIAAVAAPKVRQFKPFELSNLLWAFAKTKTYHGPLFHAARRHIEDNIHVFSRSILSTLAWVYATTDFPAQRLLQTLATKFVAKLGASEVFPVELSNLMWGLAKAQTPVKYTAYKSIGNAAVNLLSDFKLHELTIFLWAFSRVGVRYDDVFNKSADLLAKSTEWQSRMHPQGIANMLWAFAKQIDFGNNAAHTVVFTCRSLLPLATHLLPQMNAKELSCIIWSTSKLGCHRGMREHMDSMFAAFAQMPNAWFAQLSVAHRMQFLRDTVIVADNLDLVSQSQAKVHRRLAGLCAERLGESEPGHLVDLLELHQKPIVGRIPQLSTLFADAAGATVKSIDKFDRPLLGRVAGAVPSLSKDLRPSLTSAIAHQLHQIGIDECPPQERKHIAAMCGIDSTRAERLSANIAGLAASHTSFSDNPEESGGDCETFCSDDEFRDGHRQSVSCQSVAPLVQTSSASFSRPPLARGEAVQLAEWLFDEEEDDRFGPVRWTVKNTFVEATIENDERAQVRLKANRFHSV